MIACTTYSRNSLVSSNSFYGGVGDSVLVAIEDLRTASIKMTQLNYELQKNAVLDSIIKVDSLQIKNLEEENKVLVDKNKKTKTQRNTLGIISIGFIGIIIGLIL